MQAPLLSRQQRRAARQSPLPPFHTLQQKLPKHLQSLAEEAIPTQEDKKAGAHTAEQNDEAVDDYAIAAMEVRGRNQLQYKSPRQDFYGFGECEEASDDEDESGEYETDESEEEASVYTESTSVSPTNSLGKMKRACAWG